MTGGRVDWYIQGPATALIEELWHVVGRFTEARTGENKAVQLAGLITKLCSFNTTEYFEQ